MKRKKLLENKGYWISKIQLDLFDELEQYMKNNNMNRSQLAKHLGVSKGYITQVLNGDFNHRISKLVELSLAIGKVPEINYHNLEELLRNEEEGFKAYHGHATLKTSNYGIYTGSFESTISQDLEVNVKTGANQPLVFNYS